MIHLSSKKEHKGTSSTGKSRKSLQKRKKGEGHGKGGLIRSKMRIEEGFFMRGRGGGGLGGGWGVGGAGGRAEKFQRGKVQTA